MEEYVIDEVPTDSVIKQDRFYQLIHGKHEKKFGEHNAAIIRDNTLAAYAASQKQKADPEKNNNVLIVGRVQSGKTSNLELYTALAFDNGYNFVVLYGGYDNALLSQASERFRKAFNAPITGTSSYKDPSPAFFSSDESGALLGLDNTIVSDLLDFNKPIFIVAMKRPSALRKVNDLLERLDRRRVKPFIIDDEGDQASLNTEKNKRDKSSPTYAEIVRMKALLDDPPYLSVTATPQANIFLDEFSQLRPASIRLMEPGKYYCGADSYHLSADSSTLEIIADEEDDGALSSSLRLAINHFLIASAIMTKRGHYESDMIIHTDRTVSEHNQLFAKTDNYIQEFKDSLSYGTESVRIRERELQEVYEQLFSPEVRNEYDFQELFETICRVVPRTYVILRNSQGGVTQANNNLRRHKIHIGGDLLQRGITFEDLTTTYFTRWPKSGGNMDTNLQRARWFGYRDDFIDICKLFTTRSISREFTNLSEIEDGLWEQFYQVQAGELSIDDILIRAENTKQIPTRKNVATVKKVQFRSRWVVQRLGVFDRIQLRSNKRIVDEFMEGLEFRRTSAGRVDGTDNIDYAIVSSSILANVLDKIQGVFENEPFSRDGMEYLLSEETQVPVILIGFEGKKRERSFYDDNKIYVLQQGADSTDKAKVNYQGDRHVYVDPNHLNMQIHRVVPRRRINGKAEVRSEYEQYMFAFYVPKHLTYYTRG